MDSGSGTGVEMMRGMYDLNQYNPSAVPLSVMQYNIDQYSKSKRLRLQSSSEPMPLAVSSNMAMRGSVNPMGGGLWDDILGGINTAANVFEKVAPVVTPFLSML